MTRGVYGQVYTVLYQNVVGMVDSGQALRAASKE